MNTQHAESIIALVEKEESEAVAAAAVRAAENTTSWGWNAACRHSMNVAAANGFSERVGKRLYCLARRLRREEEEAQRRSHR